jgi:hypothetical protein
MKDHPNFRYVQIPGGDHETPIRNVGEGLEWVLDQLNGLPAVRDRR